jgi:hypothetical protein
MDEVARAVAVVGMDRLGRADGLVGEIDQGAAQGADLFDQFIQRRRLRFAHGRQTQRIGPG